MFFYLLGCHDVWTVFNEAVQKTSMHTFMVLAQDASTTVSSFFEVFKLRERFGELKNNNSNHVFFK